MKDSKEKRAAEIQDSIRQILYREWDPIKVSGAGPDDEYDSYIAPVYRILAGSRVGGGSHRVSLSLGARHSWSAMQIAGAVEVGRAPAPER